MVAGQQTPHPPIAGEMLYQSEGSRVRTDYYPRSSTRFAGAATPATSRQPIAASNLDNRPMVLRKAKNGKATSARMRKPTRSSVGNNRRVRRGSTATDTFPVVGIGASAGGLDAFKKFFSTIPGDCGMAFVLIQHLDPTRKSLTAELVGASTPMRVIQAKNGMRVEANHVYVIPPNKYLTIRGRALRLSAPAAPRALRMAVDYFLRSLADDQHENAIGIVLSGTGTDGTLGSATSRRRAA
jgi:chemotaxis response regulator CheB